MREILADFDVNADGSGYTYGGELADGSVQSEALAQRPRLEERVFAVPFLPVRLGEPILPAKRNSSLEIYDGDKGQSEHNFIGRVD
ncbi:MAG TPA: hypothetical protein VFT49_00375 [Candidatus Saccharimonadales bacterium]|nr:hypothetical protein [Candidatus Saccharimonadales bacterium]